MRNILLGTAALLACVAPGAASADTNGYVSFSYNTLDDDNDSNKEDYLELSGAVASSLGGSWNIQFDASSQNMNHSGHVDNFATTTVHAFSRGEGYAFGGFGGFTQGEADAYVVGAEGALYLDRITLAGSAFLGGDREDNDIEVNGFGGVGTIFLSDNFSLGADVSYYEFDFGGGSVQDGTIYGVNAEFQLGNAFSIFGGYHISDEDYFGADKEVDSFTIGGRFNLGTSTLLERDRNGASMPGASQLSRTQPFSW